MVGAKRDSKVVIPFGYRLLGKREPSKQGDFYLLFGGRQWQQTVCAGSLPGDMVYIRRLDKIEKVS